MYSPLHFFILYFNECCMLLLMGNIAAPGCVAYSSSFGTEHMVKVNAFLGSCTDCMDGMVHLAECIPVSLHWVTSVQAFRK